MEGGRNKKNQQGENCPFETFEKLGDFHHPQKDDGLF